MVCVKFRIVTKVKYNQIVPLMKLKFLPVITPAAWALSSKASPAPPQFSPLYAVCSYPNKYCNTYRPLFILFYFFKCDFNCEYTNLLVNK